MFKLFLAGFICGFVCGAFVVALAYKNRVANAITREAGSALQRWSR